MKQMPTFELEDQYWQEDYTVIGIDEVGRGCLAGPVTVGAVALENSTDKKKWLQFGINDSKKLSATKRESICETISSQCTYSLSFISTEKINSLGIVQSILEGMAESVQNIIKSLHNKKIVLLIDGLPISHIPYINDIPRVSVVKGDGKSISIASASIIAKVKRDSLMEELSSSYPNYMWDENKGYGTLKHRNAIQKYGISPYHRTKFVRNILRST